ncbi:TonB-dependent receptor [Chitinophagaceae bacterium 26-R-25]|nr:TonB-dependent receptor [Chitinophagaceae bacterium 26-R-25]
MALGKHICKHIVYLVAMSCMSIMLHAQDTKSPVRKVEGTVNSEKDGAVIPGASIRVKGSKKGTTSDENGKFHLVVRPGDTLVVTAVGFAKLETPCNKDVLPALRLLSASKDMNEIVVVGYGNERKRNITGSITSISGAELNKAADISFDNAINGKAAGVNVLSSSGVPGSATAITIRGLSTLNPDGNQPLIVIDGMPVYGSGKNTNTSSFRNSTTATASFGGVNVSNNLTPEQSFENNPLASLNPADIESIEILKDAYATSIYGSRGSAGVILITTKKGNKGKTSFNVRYTAGAVQPIGKYSLLDGPQYNDIYTTYYKELGANKIFNSPYNTNWQDEVTRTAFTQQADVSMAGGTDKAQFFISGSYTDQPSYVINNDYKRYTGRVNVNYQASKAISLGVNMSMNYSANSSMNAPAIYRAAITKAPNLPVKDSSGNYYYGIGTNPYGKLDANPVADANLNTNTLNVSDALGNIFLQYKPYAWLSLRSEFGTQFTSSNAYTRRVKLPSGFGDDAVQSTANNRKIVVNNTINFLKTFSGNHYINAIVGQSYEQSNESTTGIGGYGFFNDNIKSITAANRRYVSSALNQKWALVSYFARANYEFENKYLAGITYRIDGSSRFASNNRYVGFPSFSAGWRISQESFLKDVKWITDLKVRGSLGYSGNNSTTSYYGSQGQYVINSDNITYAGTPILQMAQPDNPNLKWERTRSVDIGLDATLFDSRLTVVFDYYQRRIKDMILSSAIPLYQGWTSQPQNIGDMMNKGLELTITSDIIRRKNFSWALNFNISRNTNKIVKLNFGGEEVGLANDAYKYMKEGEPAAQFFLYTWQGVDPMTGNPLWNDNKGGVSTIPPASLFAVVNDVNDFRKPYGTSLPDFFGGLGNTFTYKNWELNAFLSFSYGGKMINGAKATLLTYATADAANLGTDILDHWLVPGHTTDIPKLANASITTSPGSASSTMDFTTSRTISRFLEDASYLRLRTLSLAYNVRTEKLMRATKNTVRTVQIFARASNLFTLTKYTGLDPEVNAFGSSALQSGYDEITMPQNKMYQVGFNVGL